MAISQLLTHEPGRVAEVLDGTPGIGLLHDGLSGGCLAVGPAGVFVVEADHDEGKVVKRTVGGWHRPEERLYVGGRDRTEVLEGLAARVGATREMLRPSGLGSVPVSGVVCFVGARWPLFICRPLRLRGSVALWPDALAGHVVRPGVLDGTAIARITDVLAEYR